MKYPKMILFDYGHTLLYEPGWDLVRGYAELLNIDGASQTGIYPVWYDNDTVMDKRDKYRSDEYLPQCEHLHIHEWSEMMDLLERLKP